MKTYTLEHIGTGIRAEWNYDRSTRSWWFHLKDMDGYSLDTPDLNFAYTRDEIEQMAKEELNRVEKRLLLKD